MNTFKPFSFQVVKYTTQTLIHKEPFVPLLSVQDCLSLLQMTGTQLASPKRPDTKDKGAVD